jgi:protein TonB
MMLDSNSYTSGTQDRFMVFLVLAIALHALLLFGVSFGVSLNPVPRLVDTLDVVLVQWRSESEPDQADYLAQISQKGGGEITEKPRLSGLAGSQLPTPQDGQNMRQAVEQIPEPEVDVREVLAVEIETNAFVQETTVEQPEIEQANASQLMQQSLDMTSLLPEISFDRQNGSKLKRKKFISANTKEYEFASYMSTWVSKVERVGNLNYPSNLRRKKLHGDLVLMVGIQQNGTVESIDVMRSSGITEIDQAAVNIVQLAAPYSPLPDNITDRVDILHITRTWRFETGFGVE